MAVSLCAHRCERRTTTQAAVVLFVVVSAMLVEAGLVTSLGRGPAPAAPRDLEPTPTLRIVSPIAAPSAEIVTTHWNGLPVVLEAVATLATPQRLRVCIDTEGASNGCTLEWTAFVLTRNLFRSVGVPVGEVATVRLRVEAALAVADPLALESLPTTHPATAGADLFAPTGQEFHLRVRVQDPEVCRFGEPPCMRPARERPHCAHLDSFRFFLEDLDEPVDTSSSSTSSPSSSAASSPSSRSSFFPAWESWSIEANRTAAHDALRWVLQHHPQRTWDPMEACVFIPIGLNLLCDVNWCRTAAPQAMNYLLSLPHWHGGRDHVLFHASDHAVDYEIGVALVAKSSFGPEWDRAALNPTQPDAIPRFQTLRPGFDIVTPLSYFRCYSPVFRHLSPTGPVQDPITGVDHAELTHRAFLVSHASTTSSSSSTSSSPSSSTSSPPLTSPSSSSSSSSSSASSTHRTVTLASLRPLLLSFKGAVYDIPRSHPGSIRHRLRALHNGHDIVIATLCVHDAPRCHTGEVHPVVTSRHPDCPLLDRAAEAVDFEAILHQSAFSAVVAGEGTHSYRVLEVLRAGAIPVFLGHAALPFEDLIPWDAGCGIVHRDDSVTGLAVLPARLRRISRRERDALQRCGQTAYDRYLATLPRHVHGVFATLARRFATKLAQEQSSTTAATTAASGTAGQTDAESKGENEEDDDAMGSRDSKNSSDEEGGEEDDPWGACPASMHAGGSDPDALSRRVRVFLARIRRTDPRALLTSAAHWWHAQEGRQEVDASRARGTRASDLFATEERRDARSALVIALDALARDLRSVCAGDRWSALADAAHTYLTPSNASTLSSSTSSETAALVDDLDPTLLQSFLQHLHHAHTECWPTPQLSFASAADATLAGTSYIAATHLLSLLGRDWLAAKTAAQLSVMYTGSVVSAVGMAPLARTGLPWQRFVDALSRATFRATIHEWQGWNRATWFHREGPKDPGQWGQEMGERQEEEMEEHRPIEHGRDATMGGAREEADTISASTRDRLEPQTSTRRIVVTTYCDYDAGDSTLTPLSFGNKIAYCQRHNYDCQLDSRPAKVQDDRPPAWNKLLTVIRALERGAEWVVWLDCDSFITNGHVSVDDVLGRVLAAEDTEKEAREAQERGLPTAEATIDLILSEDAAMLNTGVFLVRNTPWTRALLHRAYGSTDPTWPFVHHCWWEQAAFLHLLAEDTGTAREAQRRVRFVPQSLLNPYPAPIACQLRSEGRALHAAWRPADWVVSFSGCRIFLGRESCEALFRAFADLIDREK